MRLVKTLGMVNAAPDFAQHPAVINGFSDLMSQVFGADHGVVVRIAVGMGSLPGNISVEVEAIFEVKTAYLPLPIQTDSRLAVECRRAAARGHVRLAQRASQAFAFVPAHGRFSSGGASFRWQAARCFAQQALQLRVQGILVVGEPPICSTASEKPSSTARRTPSRIQPNTPTLLFI